MFLCLATAEDVKLTLMIISLVVDVVMAVALAYVANKSSKIDKLEESLNLKTEQLVDAKFQSHTGTLQQSIAGLTTEIRAITKRLDDGEGDFEKLGNSDQRHEVRMAQMVGDLKEFMRETFATREDMKEHEHTVAGKFDRVGKDMADMGKQMAIVATKIETFGR